MVKPSLLERLLRALVRLLPEDFRVECSGSIQADLADRRKAGDRAGLIRRDLPSLIAALVREHLSALRQDLKYAVRMMRRTPGFTVMAVLMLALGTGVNVAMFSVIDAVMLRSPFREPERIVMVQSVDASGRRSAAVPRDRMRALASAGATFVAVAGLTIGPHIVTGTEDPFSPDVECVSASMFDVLGTPPYLGRGLAPFDDRPDALPAAVLSFGLWKRLGGAPSTVGSTSTVNQTTVTVIGVMPEGFSGARSRSDVQLWLPLARPIAGGGSNGCGTSRTVSAYARLQDEVTIEEARSRVPDLHLVSLNEQTFGHIQPAFLALVGAVACVLLIACLNVGGLQMERMLARQREMSMRTALGASRGRLIRQTLTENVLLALIGTGAGIATTWLTLQAIVTLLPTNLPHLDAIRINIRVLMVGLAAGAGAGVVAGLLPVALTRHTRPAHNLAGGARVTRRHGHWTRRLLVLVEVGLSLMVLIGAGLMVRTFLTLRPDRPGFDPVNKLVLRVNLPGASPAASEQFFTALFGRLEGRPGIGGVAGARLLPMVFGNVRMAPVALGESRTNTNVNLVISGYLDAMKIPVVAGRAFRPGDTKASAPVAVINEALASRLRSGGRVLGEYIAVGDPCRPDDPPVARREIVGVIANTRSAGWDTIPRTEMYVPYAQDPSSTLMLIVQSDGRNASVATAEMRSAVRALRPDLVVDEVFLMSDRLDRTVQFWRFGAGLLGVFAALAVILAAIGLMTTIGWWVRQRTQEIGVRVALGATRGSITGLVLRQGVTLAAIGIGVGCALAAGATPYLESWLYGVKPLDGRTFVGAAGVMLAVAIIAVLVPVRRAASVDPAVALRSE